MSKSDILRSKAPLRISFGGGGTDVDPYRSTYGGCTLSTSIDKYAYVSCRPRKDNVIQARSLDFNIVAQYDTQQDFVMDGELDLAKAVIARLKQKRATRGFDLFMHTDAPPGSGLGSSSTMVVALVNVFKEYYRRPLTSYEIAAMAYEIERVSLGLKGGMQDQYCATFGGFNFIEYLGDKVIVNPLRLAPATLLELQYNLILCYTGRTRQSAGIIDEQMAHVRSGDARAVDATHELKSLCVEMKNALLQGDLSGFGALLHQSWLAKKQIASKITNARIDKMYKEARRLGALGGKIVGAGGGGHLLLYAPFDRRHVINKKLASMGGQPIDFRFDFEGAVTWRAQE
ncbi:MAG: GHMP kinase [Candidatus Hydrogenedentes bacterium]|nr:GHMP kinase [Candidatus Hydrogenedentota bacterium]